MTIRTGGSSRGLLAGVDVGGTKVLAVAIDPTDPSVVVAEARVPTPDGEAPLLDAMAEAVRALGVEVRAVGVGIAGLVDLAGVLQVGPNLPGLRGVRVGHELDRRLELSIRVDNDATCAAWGELYAGAASGASDVVCLTLGTGIGAGIIAGGELVRGAHGFGGEPGHMVIDPSGPPCPCGRNGCWERFASGSGLGRLARDAAEAGRLDAVVALAGGAVELLQGEHVTRAAIDGDVEALDVMRTFAGWVALGIANLVTLVDCSLVVIGGGLVEAGDVLLDPVRTSFAAQVMAPEHRGDVRIVAAQLGEHAGAIGAALLGGRDSAS